MPRALEHPELADVSIEQVLAALADPVRLEIVRMLATADEPLACGTVTDNIPKSTASHHWKVLRKAGVIRQTSSGTSRLNALRRRELNATFPGLLNAVLRSR
ncbi:MAG: helix-turn-helix domain-containing protein [Planctomycetota bacterium]